MKTAVIGALAACGHAALLYALGYSLLHEPEDDWYRDIRMAHWIGWAPKSES